MELGQLIGIMWDGILETLYMTLISTLLAYLLGIPLGVVLFVTDKDGIAENGLINIRNIGQKSLKEIKQLFFEDCYARLLPYEKAHYWQEILDNFYLL